MKTLVASSNKSKLTTIKRKRRRIGELSRDTQKLKNAMSTMALIAMEMKLNGLADW
jgi:phage terminase Nu1 subunit (DNA packaging protein)